MAEQDTTQIPVIYSNNVRLGVAFTDFRLFIGENIPSSPPKPLATGQIEPAQAIQTIERVCIVFTPDVIPQVIDGLTQAIKLYESNFGPLRKQKTANQEQTEPAKQ